MKDPELLTDADFPIEFGRYRLLSLVGEGGMARVFAAERSGKKGFRKPCAIKVMRTSVVRQNPKLARRYLFLFHSSNKIIKNTDLRAPKMITNQGRQDVKI